MTDSFLQRVITHSTERWSREAGTSIFFCFFLWLQVWGSFTCIQQKATASSQVLHQASAELLPKRVAIKCTHTLSSGASSWTAASACQARASWRRDRTCFLRTSYNQTQQPVRPRARPPRCPHPPEGKRGTGARGLKVTGLAPAHPARPGPKGSAEERSPAGGAGTVGSGERGAAAGPHTRRAGGAALPTEAPPSPRVSTAQARQSGGWSGNAQRGP